MGTFGWLYWQYNVNCWTCITDWLTVIIRSILSIHLWFGHSYKWRNVTSRLRSYGNILINLLTYDRVIKMAKTSVTRIHHLSLWIPQLSVLTYLLKYPLRYWTRYLILTITQKVAALHIQQWLCDYADTTPRDNIHTIKRQINLKFVAECNLWSYQLFTAFYNVLVFLCSMCNWLFM